MTRLLARVRALLRPKIFLPLILAAALLTLIAKIGDLPKAFSQIRATTETPAALLCLLLAAAYLFLKGLQFRLLLEKLGIYVGWRNLALAFAIGEMTIMLPAGIYVQNYVLQWVRGDLFGLTSAATTAMLALETGVTLMALLFLPIPGWYWLYPLIFALLGLAVAAGLGVAASPYLRVGIMMRLRNGRLKFIDKTLAEILEGLARLWQPRLLLFMTLLTVAYLLPLLLAFMVLGHTIGLTSLTFHQAASIYLFALAATLLGGGLLTQLGVIEAVGIGVANAWGYNPTEGLALLLGFRLIWLGSIWLLSGTTVVALRRQFRRLSVDRGEETGH